MAVEVQLRCLPFGILEDEISEVGCDDLGIRTIAECSPVQFASQFQTRKYLLPCSRILRPRIDLFSRLHLRPRQATCPRHRFALHCLRIEPATLWIVDQTIL